MYVHIVCTFLFIHLCLILVYYYLCYNACMNEEISEKAYKYIKANKNLLKSKFTSHRDFKANTRPTFIFMAGSPGAGKTEFSKELISILEKKSLSTGIMRIDADDVREMLYECGYNGKNSHLFQWACSKGVEILFDYASTKRYNAIIDGTFAHFDVSYKNIKRVIGKDYKVYIVYTYFDPVVAWGFTRLREQEDGRRITKSVFIESLHEAKENVNKIKKIFGNKVEIWLVEKVLESDGEHNIITKNIKFNIDYIDNHLKIKYNSKDLNRILKL